MPNWAPASSTVQGSSPLLLCSRYSNTVAHLATKRRTISLVLRRSPNDIVHGVPAVLVRPWSLHSPYLTRAPFLLLREVSLSHFEYSRRISLPYHKNAFGYLRPITK